MRDRTVSVSTQPCRETRQVSFSDRLLDALPVCEQSEDIPLQVLSMDGSQFLYGYAAGF